jgi:hypothetical protein
MGELFGGGSAGEGKRKRESDGGVNLVKITLLRWGLKNSLPRLALNRGPPDLSLKSS